MENREAIQSKQASTEAAVRQFFEGRTVSFTTKHGKELAVAPLLEKHLGVHVSPSQLFDTDELGTFSGEVERKFSPLETARLKCDATHRLSGADLVLASEGSFGPHPVIGFVTADEEVLLLKDYRNNLEFRAKVISLQTNMAGQVVQNWEQLEDFCQRTGFPEHGIIMRQEKDNFLVVHKGLRDWEKLKKSFSYFLNKSGSAYVETDMRAMHNPTRMKVIRDVAEQMVKTLSVVCPNCKTPGFEVKEIIEGLPCGVCYTPTRSALAFVRSCQKCQHTAEQQFPNRKQQEDAMYCDRCNP
jgi:hypothetical protein